MSDAPDLKPLFARHEKAGLTPTLHRSKRPAVRRA